MVLKVVERSQHRDILIKEGEVNSLPNGLAMSWVWPLTRPDYYYTATTGTILLSCVTSVRKGKSKGKGRGILAVAPLNARFEHLFLAFENYCLEAL